MLHDSNYGLYITSSTLYSAIKKSQLSGSGVRSTVDQSSLILLAVTFVIVHYDNTQEKYMKT
jgi:hypothetical protein